MPRHCIPLLATLLVYSDDRLFLAPTLHRAVALADDSREAARRAGRIAHPDKLEYFVAHLQRHGMTLDRNPVPDSEPYTSTSPPELVGTPFLSEPPLHCAANKTLSALSSQIHSVARAGA